MSSKTSIDKLTRVVPGFDGKTVDSVVMYRVSFVDEDKDGKMLEIHFKYGGIIRVSRISSSDVCITYVDSEQDIFGSEQI